MKPIKIEHGTQRRQEILHPGLTMNAGDSGIGAIGRIDRARILRGHVVGMHPHRDDEILTYARAGTTLHRDSIGNEEAVTDTRLMMMNAGQRRTQVATKRWRSETGDLTMFRYELAFDGGASVHILFVL